MLAPKSVRNNQGGPQVLDRVLSCLLTELNGILHSKYSVSNEEEVPSEQIMVVNHVDNSDIAQHISVCHNFVLILSPQVIATTCRPDIVEPTLLRPGRLDQHIFVPAPNVDCRTKLFSKTLKNMPMQVDRKFGGQAQGADYLNMSATNFQELCKALAGQSDGFSCADILSVCR